MKPEIARVIFRDFPDDTIKEYTEDRIKILQASLELATTWEQVLRLQGQVAEARYFLKSREYAENVLKNIRK